MAARIGRMVRRGPLHVLLVVIAVLWLVPTFGLLLTSLLPASVITDQGWWTIFSKPSLATFDNYAALFQNADLTKALLTTAEIAARPAAMTTIAKPAQTQM